ncbi:MAG: class I tRNA ligase family protein [Candidatus Paceibacterota bacterium]|jgi:isoleucyl-tRNA synthetase
MAENVNNSKSDPLRQSRSEASVALPVSAGSSDAAKREEVVLEFWRENKIFEKSVKAREGRKEFVFYDGPVTANSKPVLHTMVPFSFKDVIPRYKTMRGYHVRRKGGWDTHGLPVELQIEKKLGFKSKIDIENYGIAAFNKLCKDSVWEYIGLWKSFTERMGYWADQENPYVTYHNDYIESVWNVVKKINDRKLLYKDYKVVPWCPRCGTALSSHELAQGYEDVKDLSVYVKFKIIGFPKAYFLAWTTTPWTLPGNVALAVGKDIIYVEAKVKDEILVLAKERLSVITDPYEIIAEHKGSEMVGMQYEPLFPYLNETISGSEKSKLEKAYKVYTADFVNTADGTGIVHTAVMYGQDDFVLGTQVGLPKHHLVDLEGKFLKGAGFLEARFVRETDQNGKPTLAVDIIEDLKKRNLFFKQENYKHSYPHCWRCHTALIYYARDSWYIRMSSPAIKKQLISENKKINWEPAHIRDGRFGEWLREIKDWAISRERYWGTPLPVWTCESCKEINVLGSLDEIKSKTKKSGNQYFIARHGEAMSNVKGVVDSKGDEKNNMTERGIQDVKNNIKRCKETHFDFIFSSPMLRTRETASIIADTIGFDKNKIIFDERLWEFKVGDLDGKNIEEYCKYIKTISDYFSTPLPSGESRLSVHKRMGDFIYELEKKYSNKKILIISHGDPTLAMFLIAKGYTKSEIKKEENDFKYLQTGEIRELDFVPLPHNEDYELDLHKPYIDEIPLTCKCGGKLIRTKEVMDVWFDSGCMPFAQDHYPFDFAQGEPFENVKLPYPADFICEAIDQTRGWFYTLHAIGILMGKGQAYKNVICLGHLLDAKGKKMSKSLGNIVDPWSMIEKYGVDTLRLWMYSVNQPGESKNFDEKTVALLYSQVFGLLYNVLAFYELYRDKKIETNERPKSKNILDKWILARLDELIKLSTENLDNYKLLEPVRGVRDFINDLSTWYLRRSRERIKSASAQGSGETRDGDNAKMTLYFVLKTLAKIMAPFAPFTAEDVWSKLRNDDDKESVHLEKWPTVSKMPFDIFRKKKTTILKDMKVVREIVTLGLEARQRAKIQVRQPLNQLRIKNHELGDVHVELIKDELNVREAVFDNSILSEVELDTNITPALKAEGEYREFMRELQDERKKMGLNPGDKMPLSIDKIYKKYKIMLSLQNHMLRVAAVASLICDNFDEPLNKEEVVTACLLHDMGNIIKSDLSYFPEFLKPEGLEYWQSVKDEYIAKYGNNEHEATIKIIKEIGLSDQMVRLAGKIEFSLLCIHRDSDEMSIKITHYCDLRVGPHGVLSYDERMDEGKKRYEGRTDVFAVQGREELIVCGKEMEKQIFEKCKIKPEDINDETVTPLILELRDFMIK